MKKILLFSVLAFSVGCGFPSANTILGPGEYEIEMARKAHEIALTTPGTDDDVATADEYRRLVREQEAADSRASTAGGLANLIFPGIGGVVVGGIYSLLQRGRRVAAEARAGNVATAASQTFEWIDEMKNKYPEVSSQIDKLAEKHKLAGVQDLVRELRSKVEETAVAEKAGEQ